ERAATVLGIKKIDWQAIKGTATLDAFIDGDGSLSDYVVLNRLIIGAWATLYLDKEHDGKNRGRFYWMGGAAYASTDVGVELRKNFKLFEEESDPFNPWNNFIINPGFGAKPLLLTKIIRNLGRTNAAVFKDMYWQHLAYQDGGIELLRKIAKEGELGKE